MRELKCPNCGKTFQVDEASYADILNQVKNSEFDAEISRRLHELEKQHKTEQEASALKVEQSFNEKIAHKDAELNEKQTKINELTSKLSESDNRQRIALLEEQSRSKDALQDKEKVIAELKANIESVKKEAVLKENSLKKEYDDRLKLKEEEVAHYRDLKAMMSTKSIGESLEVHCSNEFNKVRQLAFPNAAFDKDNDTSASGTKGDFIFRDYIDGVEYISIMFEMKNEAEGTEKKHKNEDFFAKLDKDRKAKNCEYAVLVSLLEADSELYNEGIVDVSYRYPKMFVIRPQFFMAIISLLTQASRNSAQYKKELTLLQQQNVDVTGFEKKVKEFREAFEGHYQNAAKKFDASIKNIDAAIKSLEDMRANLLASKNYLRLANDDTADLSIRKLTYKNPTMSKMFKDARAKAAASGAEDSGEQVEDTPEAEETN
jgi:hypothetical protein